MYRGRVLSDRWIRARAADRRQILWRTVQDGLHFAWNVCVVGLTLVFVASVMCLLGYLVLARP